MAKPIEAQQKSKATHSLWRCSRTYSSPRWNPKHLVEQIHPVERTQAILSRLLMHFGSMMRLQWKELKQAIEVQKRATEELGCRMANQH